MRACSLKAWYEDGAWGVGVWMGQSRSVEVVLRLEVEFCRVSCAVGGVGVVMDVDPEVEFEVEEEEEEDVLLVDGLERLKSPILRVCSNEFVLLYSARCLVWQILSKSKLSPASFLTARGSYHCSCFDFPLLITQSVVK